MEAAAGTIRFTRTRPLPSVLLTLDNCESFRHARAGNPPLRWQARAQALSGIDRSGSRLTAKTYGVKFPNLLLFNIYRLSVLGRPRLKQKRSQLGCHRKTRPSRFLVFPTVSRIPPAAKSYGMRLSNRALFVPPAGQGIKENQAGIRWLQKEHRRSTSSRENLHGRCSREASARAACGRSWSFQGQPEGVSNCFELAINSAVRGVRFLAPNNAVASVRPS